MRRNKERLNRLQKTLGSAPLSSERIQAAFETFKVKGELPEERRLAWAVCRQALNAGEPIPVFADKQAEFAYHLRVAMEKVNRDQAVAGKPKEMSVRERVFREAVYAEGPIQRGAREVLVLHVERLGQDPADPRF